MNNQIIHYLPSEKINCFTGDKLIRIQNITEENVHHVFTANLVGYLFHHPNLIRRKIRDLEFKGIENLLDLFLNGNILMYDIITYVEKSPFSYFAEYELSNFKMDENNEKINIYVKYIETHDNLFQTIDKLIDTYITQFYTITLKTYLEHKINPKIIDIEKLTFFFNKYFTEIHKEIIYDLITLNHFSDENVEEKLNEIVDFNYIKNPSLLLDRVELKKYAEAMLTWLKYVYNEIKVELLLEFKPPIYEHFINNIEKYVISFEENLYTQREKVSIQSKNDIKIDYPIYIFINQQSFNLFDTIASKLSKHSEISFLFRIMSEKENPPLIVCSIKQFVEWFNTKEYLLKLDFNLKTYNQSFTSERKAYYEIIKSFIMRD